MNHNAQTKESLFSSIHCSFLCLFLLFSFTGSGFCQLVPYYPVEISFTPLGFANQVPGAKTATSYSPISSLKIVYYSNFYSNALLSFNSSLEGVVDQYHDRTKIHGYTPTYCNATMQSFLFVNDMATIVMEGVATFLTQPGTNRYYKPFEMENLRCRFRPGIYLAIWPNAMLEYVFTVGASYFSDSSMVELDPGNYSPILNDYYIYKSELDFIYFSAFYTRFFVSPYVFYNRYRDLPARSKNGVPNSRNPRLKEQGAGGDLGVRYSTPTAGIVEAAFEYEYNSDIIFDANSYTKLKFYAKAENQYLTKKWGYSIMGTWTRHLSKNFSTGFSQESKMTGELGQEEYVVDLIGIYNINKFLGLRPEYQRIYRKLSASNYDQSLFRMQVHVHF